MRRIGLRVVHWLLILLIVLCSGCGVFKKVFKTKEKSRIETTAVEQKDSISTKVDRTVTTIQDRADTIITTPARTIGQYVLFNRDSLINGMTAVRDDLIDVRLILDPTTNILHTQANIHSSNMSVKFDRLTTINKDVTEQSQSSAKQESNTKVETSSKVVEKKPAKMGVWLVAIGILIFVLVAAVYWWKKR